MRDAQFAQFKDLLEAVMYPRDRSISCIDCKRYQVAATLVGRLDYAGKDSGFGHLNAYPTRLVLQSVSEVTAQDLASHYPAKQFSTSKVRFPEGTVTGTLVDAQGQPIRRQWVEAVRQPRGSPEFTRSHGELTDDDGNFTIAVPPGDYVLGVNALFSWRARDAGPRQSSARPSRRHSAG